MATRMRARQRRYGILMVVLVILVAIQFNALSSLSWNFSTRSLLQDEPFYIRTDVKCRSYESSSTIRRTLPRGQESYLLRETSGSLLKSDDSNDNNNMCTIYLAPSSVSDNQNRPAGFGIFTTRTLPKGSYVFPHGEGPNVVIPDVRENQAPSPMTPEWAQYIFLYPSVGFNTETDNPWYTKFSSLESNMNMGAVANFHPYLKNVLFDDTDVYQDDILNRYKDPGAGAFSYHFGKKWYTTRDVQAGEELFDDYDESWFLNYELGDAGKDIPRRDEYIQVATGMRDLVALHRQQGEALNQKYLNTFAMQLRKNYGKRALSLLPLNITDFIELTKQADTVDDYAYKIARRTVFNRSIDWIEQHGQCLDNIRPGISSISQAGQGAFATRFIPKGNVVAPVPTLLQIADKNTLNVYRHMYMKSSRKHKMRALKGEEPYTKQLILNYCYGHSKSSLLLCPATNANLINHCSPRYKGGSCKGPNAELKWATEFDPETKDWLQRSIEEIRDMVDRGRRGLSLEVVALRDIEPGEEIFIDYGPEWEEAWQRHVQTWEPPQEKGFIPVSELNKNITAYLRTEDQLQGGAYPFGVRLGCFFHGFYHPCQILEQEEQTEHVEVSAAIQQRMPVYRVRMTRWQTKGMWELGYKWIFEDHDSLEAPLSARYIRFFHGLYSSDQHLTGTFRHHIGVRDDMWPQHWKNL